MEFTPGSPDLATCRVEIERICASPEFASSRQLQEFLRYTAEKGLAGATHIDQVEIATAVLGRGEDFNPIDDASVRKLATQARQRLEQYYTHSGSNSDVVVSIPVRSYVAKFQPRGVRVPEPAPASERSLLPGLLAILAILAATGISVRSWPGPDANSADRTILIETAQGDMQDLGVDAAPAGIRLGPALRDVDELVTRLDFTPTLEAHQAGIVIWQDGDNYVRLGRRFFGRNQIEFRVEHGGHPSVPPVAHFDPDGQSGTPIWLGIRRSGNQYRGWTSVDGIRWEPVAEAFTAALARPRAGIYALNGRRETRSATARFSETATGATFDAEPVSWLQTSSCTPGPTLSIDGPTLRLAMPGGGACNYEVTRPVLTADWDFRTRLDYFPQPDQSAGIHVRGKSGAVRLVRYFLNGPAVAMIHDGKTLVGTPDLNGSPAIVLRLVCRKGDVRGSFSADGVHFQELASTVPVAELGDDLRSGIRMTSQASAAPSAARFYYWRDLIGGFQDYR